MYGRMYCMYGRMRNARYGNLFTCSAVSDVLPAATFHVIPAAAWIACCRTKTVAGSNTTSSSLRPWITVVRTETGGLVEEVLQSYVLGLSSPTNGTPNGTGSTVNTTGTGNTTGDIPAARISLSLTAAYVPLDYVATGTVATLFPAVPGGGTLPRSNRNILRASLPARLTAVRDATLAISPSGGEIYWTGGVDVQQMTVSQRWMGGTAGRGVTGWAGPGEGRGG